MSDLQDKEMKGLNAMKMCPAELYITDVMTLWRDRNLNVIRRHRMHQMCTIVTDNPVAWCVSKSIMCMRLTKNG